jgi:hypothetical protein
VDERQDPKALCKHGERTSLGDAFLAEKKGIILPVVFAAEH